MKFFSVNGRSGKLVQLRQRHSTGGRERAVAAPAWIIPSNLSGLNYKRNREGERESARLWSPPPRRPHPWPAASAVVAMEGGAFGHEFLVSRPPPRKIATLSPPEKPQKFPACNCTSMGLLWLPPKLKSTYEVRRRDLDLRHRNSGRTDGIPEFIEPFQW